MMAQRLVEEGALQFSPPNPQIAGSGSSSSGNAEATCPFTETLLYVADRAEHTTRIKEWLNEGRVVLCDRYVGSTLAYQSVTLQPYFARGAMEWLRSVNAPLIIQPTATFLLLIDPEDAMKRLGSRNGREKFEKLDFLRQVDEIYRQIAREDPSYIIIDAGMPLDEVAATVWGHISKY